LSGLRQSQRTCNCEPDNKPGFPGVPVPGNFGEAC
jgi:hypothetical protein